MSKGQQTIKTFLIEDIHDSGKPSMERLSGERSLKRAYSELAHGRLPSLVRSYRVTQTPLEKGVFKKRRSSWFYLAKAQFSRISDLGVLDLEELQQLTVYFDNWREGYRRKYVHLEREDNTHIFIKQYSRFDEDYRQFLRRKLRLLNFMLWDLKIELTVDPKKFMRLCDEFYFINKAWNRLRSWLYKRFGRFEYFKVLEITRVGRPHFHVLISGIKWIDQKQLSDQWNSYGGGKIVYVKRVSNRNKVKMCSYVMKYVNKTLRKSDKVFSALLFSSNKRLFSMSRGCQNMINVGKLPKERKGFEFAGSVLKSELVEFCNEKWIELGAFLIIKADFDDYRDFPLVFRGCGG